ARVYDQSQLLFAIPFTVTNDSPSITSVSPTSANARGVGFTLSVFGANFHSDAVVQWNGNALPTNFVNAGQLTASITPDLIASPGAVTITVANGSQLSNAVSIVIESSGVAAGIGPIITTFAGKDWVYPGNGPALSSPIGRSYGVAVDSSGNVYFSDVANN